MFIRSVVIPSLFVCAISAPLLLHDSTGPQTDWQSANVPSQFATFEDPRLLVDGSFSSQPPAPRNMPNSQFPPNSRNLSLRTQRVASRELSPLESIPSRETGSAPTQLPNSTLQRSVPFGLVSQSQVQPLQTQSTTAGWTSTSSPILAPAETQIQFSPTSSPTTQPFSSLQNPEVAHSVVPPNLLVPNIPQTASPDTEWPMPWVADPGATQTIILPGNQFGPDLTAAPLEFLPITDFSQVFRFDVSPNWVTSRWKRVSTSAADQGLHGMRVALVTGTNSWDLHGALTYYFDNQQQLQRITYRGWTGDASRLLHLLTQKFEFEPRQASPSLAGFYVVQNRRRTTGGLLMKHAPVIRADHPTERLGIVMEINNPTSQRQLSDEFQALIAGSL